MDPISNIPDSLGLYVEEIPTDEYERGDTEQLISCVHFTGDLGRLHSVPFKMVIKEVLRLCTLSNMHTGVHWVEITRGLLDTVLMLYFRFFFRYHSIGREVCGLEGSYSCKTRYV